MGGTKLRDGDAKLLLVNRQHDPATSLKRASYDIFLEV
jgi:hypothetical protein